jgi:hypothetical protein
LAVDAPALHPCDSGLCHGIDANDTRVKNCQTDGIANPGFMGWAGIRARLEKNNHMKTRFSSLLMSCLLVCCGVAVADEPSEKQLAQWLKRYPKADANGDGKLTAAEVDVFRRKIIQASVRRSNPTQFKVDPGWDAERFSDHAVCYQLPKEIAALYEKILEGKRKAITSYDRPKDGSLRIVATGHSFMMPGFQTLPLIAHAAGLKQPPLLTHVGGGMTGSARYKWEQENGIFQFDGKPTPKLLSSISNAKWDAMMWGPYYQDRPEYYSCWIDFCLKYNPGMKFYLSDAWPQLEQLGEIPKTEETLTSETFLRLLKEKHATYDPKIRSLNEKYPGKVFVLPTADAMVLAVQYYHRGELPGVEGINSYVGKKNRSLWRDRLGHLGPGFGNLEGYVFYATMYGRSPELIEGDVNFGGKGDYPSHELDRVFRRIAWEAVVNNPLAGHVDKNGDGVSDKDE